MKGVCGVVCDGYGDVEVEPWKSRFQEKEGSVCSEQD